MQTMQIKNLPFEVKEIGENGTFAGYASVFGNVDAWNDIVKAGAFKKTLAAHKKAKTMPALLWQHHSAEPLGIWSLMREDEVGLWVEGQLLVDGVLKAKEAHVLLKAGAISGLSIGYLARDYSIDEKTGIRTLKEIDLFEISLVTFPANELAQVEQVKAGNINTIRDFEAALRDVMGFSANEAKRIASHGFKAREVPDQTADAVRAMRSITNLYK